MIGVSLIASQGHARKLNAMPNLCGKSWLRANGRCYASLANWMKVAVQNTLQDLKHNIEIRCPR